MDDIEVLRERGIFETLFLQLLRTGPSHFPYYNYVFVNFDWDFQIIARMRINGDYGFLFRDIVVSNKVVGLEFPKVKLEYLLLIIYLPYIY